MPDFSKNLQNSLSGHTGDDPVVKSNNSGLDQAADVRDLLSALVGAGKGGLRPDDQSAVYSRLGTILGKDKAQKLITQALIFNERPDMTGKSAEQRITSFYDIGSRDSDLNAIIQKTKMLGQGPISGANQSSNDLTRKTSVGADVKSVAANTGNQNQLSGGLKTSSGL